MILRQRQPRQKDARYLDQIRAMPCCICGDNTSTEAAHIRTGAPEYGKSYTGMAEKPSDKWALPLCNRHHREQHETGDELKFWDFHGINPFLLAITLQRRT